MSLRTLCALAALFMFATGSALAQDAVTIRPVNVRAGPNRGYPVVAQLPPGSPVQVQGCLSDWTWCEVTFDDTAGWTYAPGLSYLYEGSQVPLYSYAPSLGIPVVTFSLVTFWDRYYRGRPWYRDRDDWAHRTFPEHLRPPREPHVGPPPHGPAPGREAQRPEARQLRPPRGQQKRPQERRPEAQRSNERQPGERRPDEPH